MLFKVFQCPDGLLSFHPPSINFGHIHIKLLIVSFELFYFGNKHPCSLKTNINSKLVGFFLNIM